MLSDELPSFNACFNFHGESIIHLYYYRKSFSFNNILPTSISLQIRVSFSTR